MTIPKLDKVDKLDISIKVITDLDNAVMIKLYGYADTYNSPDFMKQIEKLINNGVLFIIFDCTELTYVSSTGIGAFSMFIKELKRKEGDIVLMNMADKVYEIFQLLGFSQFFKKATTIEESINLLKKGEVKEEPPSIFPLIFKCPVCGVKLKAKKPGNFRCAKCKVAIAVDKDANIKLC